MQSFLFCSTTEHEYHVQTISWQTLLVQMDPVLISFVCFV